MRFYLSLIVNDDKTEIAVALVRVFVCQNTQDETMRRTDASMSEYIQGQRLSSCLIYDY